MSISSNNLIKTIRLHASSLLWTLVLVAGTAVTAVVFRPCWGETGCHGGSMRGLMLGAAGLFCITVSTLYSLRKDYPRLSIFRLDQWLYAHVVIGTLSLALIVAHSGFRLGNHVAALALLFLALTVVSGAAGLFIFYFLPRTQVRHEASILVPDDLCLRLSRLHEEISEACSGPEEVFQEVYNQLVIPLYRTEVGKPPPSADVSPWADKVGPEAGERFMNLAVKIEEAHDLLVLLGRNMRFRWWIRGWLLFHVPATIGLLVFTIVHLISMGWYRVP